MKRLSVICLGLVVILLQSCSTDSNPVNSSNNTANLYFPLTNGSTWLYSTNMSVQITNTVVGDSVVVGTTYKKVEGAYVGGTTKQYSCARNVGDGVNMPKFDQNGVMRDIVWLKDNVKVGDTWSYLSNDSGQESFYEFSCLQTGIQRTVRSKTYSDVICMKTVLGFNFAGKRLLAGTVTTYFAKGIGMIEQTATSQTQTQTMELESYTIK
ncbi:MAG: hypothetical protein U0Y96_00855 [Candidatus Kapaibacterium sp.]|nr:hypothetical protein [Bacteroidota bacterium]